MALYNTAILTSDNELCHYGVMGMKWGVRRAKNSGGSITKKQAKKEYKQDNATAKSIGKTASVYGKALIKSAKRTAKYERKLDKLYEKNPDGNTEKIKNVKSKRDASAKTSLQLAEAYHRNKAEAESHAKSLIDKYGKEAVSSIKYETTKVKTSYGTESITTMNEGPTGLQAAAKTGASMAGAMLMMMAGSPIGIFGVSGSTIGMGSSVEKRLYKENRRGN